MNRGYRSLLAILALVLISSGCSGRNTYFHQRGRDFADIWRANFSAMGPGFTLNARATQLFKFGGGFDGFKRGEAAGLGTWRVGTLGRHAGTWQSDTVEYGFGPFYYEDYSQLPVHGNVPVEGGQGWFEDGYRTFDEIGFTFHLGIFGMDFAVRPVELFDFLTGLVTLDPMGDDFQHEYAGDLPSDLQDYED